MNASQSGEQSISRVVARIIDVIEQKGSGYTVVVELPPEANISSEESWRLALPLAVFQEAREAPKASRCLIKVILQSPR
jgi:hypothetical protein